MRESDQTAYLNICIKYRVITVILCTLVYLSPIPDPGHGTGLKLGVAFGMLASCFLGIYLYKRTFSQHGQENLAKVILGLELFSYGIFTFLSGGFASPYLWYYIGCLFMMMALQRNILLTILGTAWCLLCAVAHRLVTAQGRAFTYLELNLLIGAVVIIGAFYILLHYIHRMNWNQEQQKLLNLRLEREKERSEQALRQITDLYDTLNLFAMTDPHKVMEELGMTLKRTVAPDGCILIKLNIEGAVERQEACGMEDEYAAEVIRAALSGRETKQAADEEPAWEEFEVLPGQTLFEMLPIGRDTAMQGLFIRRKTEFVQQEKKQDSFYRGFIEIIFRNLDTQKQLEEYITTEEKNRMANEIHDTVIQKLFGLVCSLKVLETSIGTLGEDALKEKLRLLKRSAELTMTELREAIYGKRFEGCDGGTFLNRMKLYMEEMERLSGTAIRMDLDENAGAMTAAQKITIYRIACEAVNNAVRHGKAERVAVRLKLEENTIQAEIEDNGTGFVRAQASPLHGNGLKNMQRMVSLLRGQFVLESGKGQGARIKLSLPR